MAEKKANFIGYVEAPKLTVKLRFTLEELEQLKGMATEKGNVYVEVHLTKDKEKANVGKAWASFYDPRQTEGTQPTIAKSTAEGDGFPF